MSIICEIDKILMDNKDYFSFKKQEFQENYNYSKKEQKTEADKFPMYSTNTGNTGIEYEE